MGYLAIDYQTPCDGDEYIITLVAGIIGVVIWPIAVAVVTVYLLFLNRKTIRDRKSDAFNRYSFLVADYRPDFWFWETIEMLRKVMLTGVVSVFDRGSLFQLFVGAMLSLASLCGSAWFQPYDERLANIFKVATEVSILVTLTLSMLLKHREEDLEKEGLTEDFIGTLMILQTCFIPIGSLAFGFSFYAKEYAESRGILGKNVREQNPLAGLESGDTGDTTPVEGAESDGFTNILDNDGSGSELEDPDLHHDWHGEEEEGGQDNPLDHLHHDWHGDEEEGGQDNPLGPSNDGDGSQRSTSSSPSFDAENASDYQTPRSLTKKGFMFSSISSLRSIGSNDNGGGTMWGSHDSANMVEFGNPMHGDDSDEDGDGGDGTSWMDKMATEATEAMKMATDSSNDQMERQRQTVRKTTT